MLGMKFAFIVGSIIILIIEMIKFIKRNKEEKFLNFREVMSLMFKFLYTYGYYSNIFSFSDRWLYRKTIYEYSTGF